MRFSAILVLHISAGIVGILSGAAAMSFRKGSARHALAGRVFVISILTMAAGAVDLAFMKHQMNNVGGGVLTFYLVGTAWRMRDGCEKSVSGGDEMAMSTIDESQHKAARVAGFAYLITFAAVAYVNFGIHDRLITDNAAETARNILSHERIFRIGIAGDLIYCAGVVVLLIALYVILKPVNRGLALLAAFWRLVWVLMWLVMALNLFDALRLLRGADYLRGFEAERLQGLARVLTTITLACYLVHWHPRSAAICGSSPTISIAGGLRCDLVRILRGVYFQFSTFSPARQDRQPMVV
jgi:hypothetical protein